MDVILIILGVLGFGAILISAYVFTVAARNYVSENDAYEKSHAEASRRLYIKRNPVDRRSHRPVQFPLTVNGMVIPQDRRQLPDRRQAA